MLWPPKNTDAPARWPALLVWALAWGLMLHFDGHIDLANKALILVLATALAAIWWGPGGSVVAAGLAVLAFNYAFVPPRGAFTVDIHQHALLLVTMLVVGWIVALLMARQRRLADTAQGHARRSDQLRQFGDTLRETAAPSAQAHRLCEALAHLGGASSSLLLRAPGAREATHVGPTRPDEAAGLQLCLQRGHPMGPHTGRHEEQPAWYLPLRGRAGYFGAALVRLAADADTSRPQREHAQALCDQMGLALERAAALQAADAARELAHGHALRNTLLAAISHDHRTPLATILGAASALHDQDSKLSPEQRRKLAATIADEATQLARLTDNTLQLARLGPGLPLQREWESIEELVGTALRRARQRQPTERIKARVEPGLPLVRCDAVLLVQLLDNLIDNALKHGGQAAPVEVVARRIADALVIAVRDRGPGVPLSQRARIFETFQRGEPHAGHERRGAGVGLALCRAIAQAHGGELRLRLRGHGGASFELVLPVEAPPEGPAP